MIEIDDWRFDEIEGTLSRNGQTTRLTPRSLAVLNHLLANRGALVTSQELWEKFWPNSFAAEHGLHKAISEIRLAFGDQAKEPRYIKTVARRGYIFLDNAPAAAQAGDGDADIQEVQREDGRSLRYVGVAIALVAVAAVFWLLEQSVDQEAGRVADAGNAVPSQTMSRLQTGAVSIAVLPFVNLTGDPETEYFGDGLAEDILHGLAASPDLNVKARTSSFFFKNKNLPIREIVEQLDTTHIVEGSVRVSDNTVRVTAQLIDALRDEHLWSGQYDRKLTEAFEVQDDITQNILKSLGAYLAPQDAHDDQVVQADAYNARLQAQFFMSRLDFDRARALYELAIQFDDNDASSHAALANLHSLDVWFHRATIEEKLPRIKTEIERALALDPNETTALAVQATIDFYVYHRYQQAIENLESLIRQRPNDSTLLGTYRGFMITIGRPERGLAALDRALLNNPFGADVHRVRGETLEYMGRFAEAERAYLRAEELGLDVEEKLGFLAISTGRLENLEELLANVQVNWGAGSGRATYLRALIAEKSGDEATYHRELQVLLSSPSYRDDLSARESIALLARDYETVVAARKARLKQYFPVYWSLPGTYAERRDYPGLHSHPSYIEMLEEIGLSAKEISLASYLELPPVQ